ncbi:hypothetical protein AC482_00395 [miscellaneous Crenarchaeota group-15 archaeon DG-45]|uniref:A-type ATP synthase subunit I n=1 Tax=miscellaneous Crenarchaeota group-15 archaeon DG-45 TaxID=1685127 RepID=A0A0M0BTQ3_9ARCH|nr:MAG: hypothetical protein AC482_00395 [miscellaneous Crenarchaeota group-15 archaeon DG-45]
MKKFTIIASPELDPLILGELSRARAVQLKEVTGVDFENLKKLGERSIDFEGLHDKFHKTYQSLVEAGHIEPGMVDLSLVELREFIDDPDGRVNEFLTVFEEIRKRLEIADVRQKERERKLLEARARLEGVRALQPDELKRCMAVGVVDLQLLQRLVEYLRRFEEISHKVVEISSETGFVFVFGPEERREWVEVIFVIFEVKDIFDVLRAQDVLLVLDAGRREEAIKEYGEEVEKLQGLVEREEEVSELKIKYAPILGKAKFLDHMLGILSHTRASALRTNVISVIQGWIPEDKVQVLDNIIEDLEEKTGELFFIEYEGPSHDDHEIPTPTPKIKPSFLQPAWTLTSLRGWPSANEVNPIYITILIFSFQFGLMYGDIGQGLIFFILGLVLSRKYKRGMMSKLGVLFIPMGIASIIFGVLFDSFFLIEGLLFHHHSILPNPVHSPTKLMLIVFQIAVIEMVAALVLGAINEYKAGHKWGIIGEHGLGMILYVVGLYLSAMFFIRTGNFMAVMSHWTFIVMVLGMVLAMLEPIIASIAGGHFGIEVFGEGVGALLMTFVEGLANLFSFLRIAAFALAHASLAIAAQSMAGFMGVGGLLLMNTIAMSFEFISSSVQSLRLLYYEFMGKFFHGGGIRFKPFRVRDA